MPLACRLGLHAGSHQRFPLSSFLPGGACRVHRSVLHSRIHHCPCKVTMISWVWERYAATKLSARASYAPTGCQLQLEISFPLPRTRGGFQFHQILIDGLAFIQNAFSARLTATAIPFRTSLFLDFDHQNLQEQVNFVTLFLSLASASNKCHRFLW